MVAGAVMCVAPAACNTPSAGSSPPTPAQPAIEAMTFAPVLQLDIARFTRTRSGAYYRDLTLGTGAVAVMDRTVSVRYSISLPDGTVVELQNTAVDLTLGIDVIRGWREGVPGMKAGGVRTLIVPPSLGYGAKAHGPIPGQSTLIFEIQLLGVR